MAKLPGPESLKFEAPRPAMGAVVGQAQTGHEGDVALAEARQGDAIGKLGEIIQQNVNIEVEKNDTTKIEDAWNKYKGVALDATVGQNGVLNLKGGDAVNGNLVGTVGAQMQSARQTIMDGMTPQQKQRFALRADATDLQTKHQVLGHIAVEQQRYASTVMDGNASSALATVASMPDNQGVFVDTYDTLMHQADSYLDRQGITHPAAREAVKNKLSDSLYAQRVNAMMSANMPIEADKIFRETAGQIKDPILRMQLRNLTQEAAVVMHASNAAQAEVTDSIKELVKKSVLPEPKAIESGPSGGTFSVAVNSLLRREGGYKATDGNSGAPVNYGINQKANPDVDVKTLTKEGAVEIYKKRYWDKIGGDNLPPAVALVALDAAALQGVDVAKQLIAAGGGDPKEMIAIRREQLAALVKANPKQAPYYDAWMKRLDGLSAEVGQMGEGGMQRVSAQAQDAPQPNTSGMPTSKDVAAQLPLLLAKGDEKANALYGTNQNDPARAAFLKQYTAAVKSQLSLQVEQLTKVQAAYRDEIGNLVMGINPQQDGAMKAGGRAGGPSQMITSLPMLQQTNPAAFQMFQRLDGPGKEHVIRLMEVAEKQVERGDSGAYLDFRRRVYLPPGDPEKINWDQQITQDPNFNKLGKADWAALKSDLKGAQTDDGMSQAAKITRGISLAGNLFSANQAIYTENMINPAAAKAKVATATDYWLRDLNEKIGLYKQQNKPIDGLLDPDPRGPNAKESMMTPQALAPYMDHALNGATTATVLKDAAATAQQPVPAVQMPKEINSKESADAWLKQNPTAEVVMMPSGTVRKNPFYQAPTYNTPAAPQHAVPTMDENGKIGQPPAPQATPVAAKQAEDDIPPLIEGPSAPKGARLERQSPEQRVANQARIAELVKTSAHVAADGAFEWLATPIRQVQRSYGAFMQVVKALSPSEEERAVSGFRSVLKTGQFRANEDTLVMLNNALASKKLNDVEQRKATKMIKVVTDKLGIEATP